MQTAVLRAKAGLAWLTEHGAELGLKDIEHLDLDRLDIVDAGNCVLGQLGGDFHKVIRHKFGSIDVTVGQLRELQLCGFLIDHWSWFSNRQLVNAWREVVTEELERRRRSADDEELPQAQAPLAYVA